MIEGDASPRIADSLGRFVESTTEFLRMTVFSAHFMPAAAQHE
jgi:hypothetical protein